MRFNRKKKTEIMEGDLTPMIDMTFQLIAFFMIIMNFSKVDRAEEVMLPTSRIAKPPETIPDYQVILNIATDENSGEEVVKVAGSGYTLENLNSVLYREVSAAGREGVEPAKIAVIIRADEEHPTGRVQRLIAKCQENDLENFVLRVKEDR